MYFLSFRDRLEFECLEICLGVGNAVAIIKDFSVFCQGILLHSLILEEVLVYLLGSSNVEKVLLDFCVVLVMIVSLDVLDKIVWVALTPNGCLGEALG